MKNSNRMWTMRSDGNLDFSTKQTLTKLRSKPDTMWNHSLVLVVVIAFCALVDFSNFKQLFDSFLFARPIERLTGIVAFLIAYDALPIWIGIDLKKKYQGYKVNQKIINIMMGTFVLAFLVNLGLRLVTKDMVLPVTSDIFSGTISGKVSGRDASGNSSLATMYATFGTIIPLFTSLASGTISYIMANPLYKERMALEKQHNLITARIQELMATLEEYESNKDYFDRLSTDDNEKYEANRAMIEAHKQYLIDHTHERIEESQGNPTSTNILSKRQ